MGLKGKQMVVLRGLAPAAWQQSHFYLPPGAQQLGQQAILVDMLTVYTKLLNVDGPKWSWERLGDLAWGWLQGAMDHHELGFRCAIFVGDDRRLVTRWKDREKASRAEQRDDTLIQAYHPEQLPRYMDLRALKKTDPTDRILWEHVGEQVQRHWLANAAEETMLIWDTRQLEGADVFVKTATPSGDLPFEQPLLGESDPQLLYYTAQMSNTTAHWITTDGDMVSLYATIHLAARARGLRVLWHTQSSEDQMIDLGRACDDWIKAWPVHVDDPHTEEAKLDALVWWWILGGTDYHSRLAVAPGFRARDGGANGFEREMLRALYEFFPAEGTQKMNKQQTYEVFLYLYRCMLSANRKNAPGSVAPASKAKPLPVLSLADLRAEFRYLGSDAAFAEEFEYVWFNLEYVRGAQYNQRPDALHVTRAILSEYLGGDKELVNLVVEYLAEPDELAAERPPPFELKKKKKKGDKRKADASGCDGETEGHMD